MAAFIQFECASYLRRICEKAASQISIAPKCVVWNAWTHSRFQNAMPHWNYDGRNWPAPDRAFESRFNVTKIEHILRFDAAANAQFRAACYAP